MPIDPEAEARIERAKRLRAQIADLVSGTEAKKASLPPSATEESKREFIARRMKELDTQKRKRRPAATKRGR
jgi:hypothetical protein